MVRVAQPADQVVLGPAGVNDDDRGRRANARVNDLVVPGVQFAPGRQRFRFLRVLQRIVDDDEIRGLAGAGTAAADERHPAAARRYQIVLRLRPLLEGRAGKRGLVTARLHDLAGDRAVLVREVLIVEKIGRAACREGGWQYV